MRANMKNACFVFIHNYFEILNKFNHLYIKIINETLCIYTLCDKIDV